MTAPSSPHHDPSPRICLRPSHLISYKQVNRGSFYSFAMTGSWFNWTLHASSNGASANARSSSCPTNDTDWILKTHLPHLSGMSPQRALQAEWTSQCRKSTFLTSVRQRPRNENEFPIPALCPTMEYWHSVPETNKLCDLFHITQLLSDHFNGKHPLSAPQPNCILMYLNALVSFVCYYNKMPEVEPLDKERGLSWLRALGAHGLGLGRPCWWGLWWCWSLW